MATINGTLTLNEVVILEVIGDPSLAEGTPAPKGSIALDDQGKLWTKFGDLDTDWGEVGAGNAGALLANNNLSDLQNIATARTNLGLGTAAQSNTGDFDAAGTAASTMATHNGLSDPHTQYLKESDDKLITPQIITVKVSNAGAGEFTSLTSAIASITDADPTTKPYVIELGAGVHTVNNPAILPSGVSLKGSTINASTLVPQNANQHLLVLNNMCEVSFLNLKGIVGSIGSGKAAIYAEDAGDFAQLHKLSIYDFDIGIDNFANTTSSILYSEYCDINGNYTFALRNRSTATNLARLQAENFYSYASAGTNPVHCYSSGTGAELIMNSVGLTGGADNIGIKILNGGELLISDATIRMFSGTGIGLLNENTGAGSDIDIVGAQFLNNTTDISILNPGSSTSLSITATPSKITIADGVTTAAQITDANYGGIITIGEVQQGSKLSKLTPISTLITKTGTTGSYTGGAVSAASGLSVNVTAGEGFCYDSTNDYVAKVTWGATTLSGLSANTTYYICVDSAGTVQAQTSNPGLVNKIYLARIRTAASSVLWTGSAIMESLHHGNAMETFARNMGAIYISGSIVTENGTRGLNVSSGKYQYGTVEMNPSGGTGVSFTLVTENGSGGHNFTASQTQINNTQYDNGSGTLVSLSNNYYRRDALYTSGEGANEKLFLVMGQVEYSNLVNAESGTIPTPPDWFTGTICLIASIIQKQGDTNISQIRSERPTLAFQASGVSAASVHANLTGLSADDHPQYLLTNGGRTLTGNLNLGSNNITNIGTANGVTIEAHASRHLPNGADPLATGTPSTIDGTNQTGTANAFARQDHIHAHGSQTDGTHHAAATTSVNGFMASSDKSKLDNMQEVIGYKTVRVSSAGSNINIASAPANIDFTVMVSGDRVLLFNQTVSSQNGIYVYNGSGNAMTRASDANTAARLKDVMVYVSEGSNANKSLVQFGTLTTLGTDDVTFIFPAVGYHQQDLSTITQSGATNNQVPQWNGANWVPVTLSGSPGGSTTQVQYNNAGAFAGASNVTINNNDLTLATNAAPATPPASTVKLFGKSIAGRIMPAFIGPSGLDTTVQPLLSRNKIAYWNPPGNATTVPGVFGLTAPTIVGTATARTVATTNIATRMRRIGYVSTAVAGNLASHYIANAQFTTGTGTGLGGFHFVTRFVVSDAATVTGARHFCGVSSTTAAPTNVQPNTLTNSIGMAQLSTDATQWYLVYGGSVAQTAIALGTGLGAPTLTNTAWEIALFSSPEQNAVVNYQITNLGSGVSVSGTLSGTPGTTVPASTTLLTYRQFRTNNTTALAVGVDICSIYIETDN
jgi:hypothetical protein